MKGNMDSETTTAKPAPQKEQSNLLSSLLHEFRRNKLILYYVSFIAPFTFIINLFVPENMKYDIYSYIDVLITICYVTFMVWATYYYCHLLFKREKSPTIRLIKKVKSLLFPISKPIYFVLLMLVLNISFSSYTFIKSLIPHFNPYNLDLTFYHLDKWLHFGISPWEITHFFLPNAASTLMINFLYNLWFFLMWGMLLFFIVYRKNDQLRNQFILTFLVSWFLFGNVMATLLSSAGPVFFHHFHHQDLYLELMQRLDMQNHKITELSVFSLWTLSAQDMLWDSYVTGIRGRGTGISAMPSLHVTIAVLMAMTAFRLNKNWGYIAWVYAFFVQVGSVHLAWHYAIDGYIGALMVVALWHLIGYLLRRNSSSITQPQ
ncbi:phosphatase PAP2 family protein [Vibrio splendidus]|uniref:phosphatase PAP2 family protein n=1 Tax=Vibrio splendidus TaxID=29497 RepID=UPI000C846A3C|nr:phosphatase PAP2 family protein [Vibrio splendidus]